MQKERDSEGRKIYEQYINNQPGDFWMYPSQKGLEIMKGVRKRMIKLGNGVFSGFPEYGWTFRSNADVVDSLTRRIARWESELSRADQEKKVA